MSPFFTLLKDLQPYTSKWVIKARCVRAYEVSGTSNKINISSLDCVLEDKEGTQIHASFPRDIMHKFKDQIKENKVLCEKRVGTYFNVSKVLLNYDSKEVHDLRKWFSGDARINLTKQNVGKIMKKALGEYEDLKIISLEDILCLEIETVFPHYGEWFYLSCKICGKKVDTAGEQYYCNKCTKHYYEAIERYRFVVNVVDSTFNASLLIWDRESRQMMGKKVGEVVSADMEPFSVIKMCTMPHIIEKYMTASLISHNTEVGELSLNFSDLLFGSDILNEMRVDSMHKSVTSTKTFAKGEEWIMKASSLERKLE
ncbi:replication protein A 70 kDa DNA-binding subunit A-like [Salvia splendens]|uniref:replication protein A 70 kDa DNA-binding subunit A-like n=1 Tax=Salvia splendens TaxID=180675 RepID=UPI001C258EF1|nr:replication protein A 70 kDa DNA-binding subunit A-like [Salvia splendens]